MSKWILSGLMIIFAATAKNEKALGGEVIEKLKDNQKIADFRVENVYDNEMGQAMGARFRHIPSGFVLDFLRIQSIPQGFIWVNTFPPSDQGEPHTCEHLLLGKGTKGRYVASLEDMSLSESSAFTMQLQTCYHFNTTAGTDVFYDQLEKRLDALLNPNFSDEEIRREVCNIGYSIDPVDSALKLEEKGTVYNEMTTSFERPWSNLGRRLDHLLYGPDHPLSYSSGGYPEAIRSMTPEDMRNFIHDNYHLNNMGVIVSVPDDVKIDDFLKKVSKILKKVEPDVRRGADPATAEDRLPPPVTAPAGEISLTEFPNQNPNEPGLMIYAWPPVNTLDANEEYLLDLFLDNLAGGETSNLYRKFIDSETRIMDLGANSVFGWFDNYPGYPIYIGFNNVKREITEAEMIAAVRSAIMAEISRIAGFADGSEELTEFNDRVKNKIIQRRRGLRKFLNSPPGFGFRGSGSQWMAHLKHLRKVDGFRKKLTLDGELGFAEQLVSTNVNFWTGYIKKWGLLRIEPFGVATRSNPEMAAEEDRDRDARLKTFVEGLEKKYGITDPDKAIRKYKSEYDANTSVIDREAAKIPMPEFAKSPPMSLDDRLDYRQEKLSGRGPLVISTFESMTSATAGLAFNMYAVPESLLPYVSALPTLLTEVGVIKDGKPLAYDKMIEEIRKEILEVRAYYSVNNRTERVELVLRGSGSDRLETEKAVDWMETLIFTPDWREENLPRIRDAVDLSIKNLRNTMKMSEEAWVNDPANAYWKQKNLLMLCANSFLTETHALHRLRWMLKDPGSEKALSQFSDYMNRVASDQNSQDRLHLIELISTMRTGEGFSGEVAKLLNDAADDLERNLADIPDASLADDWKYLCGQMAADLAVPPGKALNDLKSLTGLIFNKDNARGFLIANTTNQKSLIPKLNALAEKLGGKTSKYYTYRGVPLIINRMNQRNPRPVQPVYVGLVNENTRLGVFINRAKCASFADNDPEKLLRFLAARLYGGGGAHSMFMKTWGAGLAYSNGLRSSEADGMLIYYAERCPDLAQTMQFVVNELKNAPYDPTLSDYAVAQAFLANRAGGRYEQRGEAMAADLSDGLTPEVVGAFRQGILDHRADKGLYDKLHNIMESVYGEVLPGYGPRGDLVDGAIYFIIGPEKQFQSYQEYLDDVEGNAKLYEIYPRDYWVTGIYRD